MLSKEYLPGLRDRIIARSVQSPLDYERRIITAVHGTHQHGAFLPYQIGAMRPIPEFGSYRSHQAISAPKLWNPQGWQIVADGGSDRLLSLCPSSM